MNKIFKIFRNTYTTRTTIGDFFVPDQSDRFAFTLEDTVRAEGIKVYGETALAEGTYILSTSISSRFKREMPIIFTENDRVTATLGGITFIGARLHGGNTHKDTQGCPLVAFNKVNDTTIQGTAESFITTLIREYEKEGNVCYLQIVNVV